MMKKCYRCHKSKPCTLEFFYRKRESEFESYCKECKKEIYKKHYYKNLEKERKKSRERKRNRDELQIEKSRKMSKLWNQTPNGIYNIYKKNARKRKIKFNIAKHNFTTLVNKQCYYCGEKSKGIDRINNKNGYVEGNCVSCCGICNRMKMDMELKDFLKQCKKILNFVPFPNEDLIN